jgi:hypothetical protein
MVVSLEPVWSISPFSISHYSLIGVWGEEVLKSLNCSGLMALDLASVLLGRDGAEPAAPVVAEGVRVRVTFLDLRLAAQGEVVDVACLAASWVAKTPRKH